MIDLKGIPLDYQQKVDWKPWPWHWKSETVYWKTDFDGLHEALFTHILSPGREKVLISKKYLVNMTQKNKYSSQKLYWLLFYKLFYTQYNGVIL